MGADDGADAVADDGLDAEASLDLVTHLAGVVRAVSVADENDLELDSGNGCTTL